MGHTTLMVPVKSYLLLAAALQVLPFACPLLQGSQAFSSVLLISTVPRGTCSGFCVCELRRAEIHFQI